MNLQDRQQIVARTSVIDAPKGQLLPIGSPATSPATRFHKRVAHGHSDGTWHNIELDWFFIDHFAVECKTHSWHGPRVLSLKDLAITFKFYVIALQICQ